MTLVALFSWFILHKIVKDTHLIWCEPPPLHENMALYMSIYILADNCIVQPYDVMYEVLWKNQVVKF